MVGLVMAMIAFVLEKMVLRSVRKAGKGGKGDKGDKGESREELHTTLTSKGGEVDLTDVP